MSPQSAAKPLIAMLRLGEVLVFFSVVTGAGSNGEGGGEVDVFSFEVSLFDGGDAEEVELVDETERLVLRRSRMAAKFFERSLISVSPSRELKVCLLLATTAHSTMTLPLPPTAPESVVRPACDKCENRNTNAQ